MANRKNQKVLGKFLSAAESRLRNIYAEEPDPAQYVPLRYKFEQAYEDCLAVGYAQEHLWALADDIGDRHHDQFEKRYGGGN